MQDSSIQIQEEADLIRNEIVVDTFETVRVLGWTDQFEEDYYWVLLRRTPGFGTYLQLHSCVMGFIRLKNYIPNKEYEKLERIWNLNYGTVEEGLRLAKEQSIEIK